MTSPPVEFQPHVTADSILSELRRSGWTVASHSDCSINGVAHVSWLLTHSNGGWVKGDDRTDLYALAKCRHQIERYSLDGGISRPYAVRVRDDGWIELGFDTAEKAQQFWRWIEKKLANAARCTARRRWHDGG